GGRGGFGGGGFGGGNASLLGLLRIPEVQKELELVDEQMTAITKLQEEARAAFGGGKGGPPGGDGQKGRTKGKGGTGASLQNIPAEWFFVQQNQQGQGQQGQKGRGGFQLTDE